MFLRDRGLRGVQSAISDDHAGLKPAIPEVLPEAIWQRLLRAFPANAPNSRPPKAELAFSIGLCT
jgi:putative transposase